MACSECFIPGSTLISNILRSGTTFLPWQGAQRSPVAIISPVPEHSEQAIWTCWIMGPMIQQVQMACSECSGTGEMIATGDRCAPCQGKKVVPERKMFEINVEPGMKHGQKIVLRGRPGSNSRASSPGTW